MRTIGVIDDLSQSVCMLRAGCAKIAEQIGVLFGMATAETQETFY